MMKLLQKKHVFHTAVQFEAHCPCVYTVSVGLLTVHAESAMLDDTP